MKCLILAAGYATRLYPLTENFPKPLLKIGKKTILDWLIDDIKTSGEIDQYIVISNHKFVGHFNYWAMEKDVPIVVLDDGTVTNETRLGAVRDIQFAIDELKLDDDLLIMAGDNLLDFSLNTFIDYAKEKQASCTMRYYEPEKAKLQKSGVLTIGEDERILKMAEKPVEPESNWCSPAFYYYKREDVSLVRTSIDDGCNTDAPGSFISWLCQKRPVFAMEMPGKRYDIGTIDDYNRTKEEWREYEK